MSINFEQLAIAIGLTTEQYLEYQYHSLNAVRKELEETKKMLLEISEVSAKKAEKITVVIDEVFLKPINELKK